MQPQRLEKQNDSRMACSRGKGECVSSCLWLRHHNDLAVHEALATCGTCAGQQKPHLAFSAIRTASHKSITIPSLGSVQSPRIAWFLLQLIWGEHKPIDVKPWHAPHDMLHETAH